MVPLALVIAAVLSADPVEVTLDAERVVHDGQKQLSNAEGHAALRTAGAALDGERIVYDEGRQVATATDQVVLRLIKGGPIVVVADVVTVRFEGGEVSEVYFFEGEAYGKAPGLSADALLAARTPAAAKALGRNTLRLEGNHLVRHGTVWQAEALDLVPCDCDLTHPSWKIHTTQAYIDGDARRVSVVAPSVWIHGVPVLWLPWLYLPLSNRQTGLLMPRPLISKQNGFGLEWPVFITLGRSADLTLTPGFFTGGTDTMGVAGPRLNTEFRYVPSTRVSGRVTLGLIYDLRAPRDPVTGAMAPSGWSPLGVVEQPGARGLRGEASWQHSQDFGGGFGARVDASVHSDGYYQRDVVTDVIARENGYLRSAATLFQRGVDHVVGLDVVLRQDLTGGGWGLFGSPRLVASAGPRYGPNTFQRWPALQVAVPLRPIAGPLAFSLEASAVRLAPLWGQTGDEGVAAREGRADDVTVECLQQRLYYPSLTALPPECGGDDKAGQGDRRWQPGERSARDRLDVLPRLFVGGTAFDALALSAFAGWRQSAWYDEVTGKPSFRGYPLLGGRAETELARVFEGGLRHALVPAVEVRAVPLVTGAAPAPYDEIDGAVPAALGLKQGVVQANVELGQRLMRKGAPDAVRLDLGQGFELWGPYGANGRPGPRLGESWARVASGWGPFRASATGRLDTRTGLPTRIAAAAGLDGGPTRGLYANYEYVLDDGNLRSRAPIDLLFGAPPVKPQEGAPAQPASFTHLLALGGRYKLWELTFRYDALFSNPGWQGTVAAPVRTFTLVQHTLGIGWSPNCDCWRLDAWLTHRLDVNASLTAAQAAGRPVWTSAWPIDFGATFTVSQFGSFGR